MFIDLDRDDKPVLFVTPGKGKDTITRFKAFLEHHGGDAGRIVEVVCDMSKAFLAAVTETFDKAAITVDWFHVVQLFTKAVDQVRRAEAKHRALPNGTRWATLKAKETLTKAQAHALADLETGGFGTAEAWRSKEMLRWVRKAHTSQAARWHLTHFIRHVGNRIDAAEDLLTPLRTALDTVITHAERIIERWCSGHSNARLEGRAVQFCRREGALSQYECERRFLV